VPEVWYQAQKPWQLPLVRIPLHVSERAWHNESQLTRAVLTTCVVHCD
jgi:hypothetical protein